MLVDANETAYIDILNKRSNCGYSGYLNLQDATIYRLLLQAYICSEYSELVDCRDDDNDWFDNVAITIMNINIDIAP